MTGVRAYLAGYLIQLIQRLVKIRKGPRIHNGRCRECCNDEHRVVVAVVAVVATAVDGVFVDGGTAVTPQRRDQFPFRHLKRYKAELGGGNA